MPETKDLPSELYTTEAAESKSQALADKTVPDPSPEEGKKILLEEINNGQSKADGRSGSRDN